MKKSLSLLLCVAMLATLLTTGMTMPALAEKDQNVIFDSVIDEDVDTENSGVTVLASEAVQEALRQDIAENGPLSDLIVEADATLVSDLRGYGYFSWALEEQQADGTVAQLRCSRKTNSWAGMTGAAGETVDIFRDKVNFCLCSDGPGVKVHIHSLKLTAVHAQKQVYKFTFEDPNASSVMKKNGVPVGEIVEWPEGSGNHCLKVEINAQTRTGGGGVLPYLWPEGIDDVLAAQGSLTGTGSKWELHVDMACSQDTTDTYLYPFMLCNDKSENYAVPTEYCAGQGKFTPGTFVWKSFGSGAPVQGAKNGGIAFCDDGTMRECSDLYIDNLELCFAGAWQEMEDAFVGYFDGTPCEESDIMSANPTKKPSNRHNLYTFTFEDENATSILMKNGEYIGDVVEWPEGSGNHCLRYEINEETRGDYPGEHPLIVPIGVRDVLAFQGDLKSQRARLELTLDMACSLPVRSGYLYPYLLSNNNQRSPAEASMFSPGNKKFSSAYFEWIKYSVDPPQPESEEVRIALYDEQTLQENSVIYVDNISLTWNGMWEDIGGVFIGYPNGTPCEETDLERAPAPTETQAEPTETQADPTETQAEPTETQAEPTETGSTAKETKPTTAPTKVQPKITETTPVNTTATATNTEAPTVLAGDANGDGVVNMKDVLTIRKYMANLDTAIDLLSADANGDGVVNMKDVLSIRKFIAGLLSSLC